MLIFSGVIAQAQVTLLQNSFGGEIRARVVLGDTEADETLTEASHLLLGGLVDLESDTGLITRTRETPSGPEVEGTASASASFLAEAAVDESTATLSYHQTNTVGNTRTGTKVAGLAAYTTFPNSYRLEFRTSTELNYQFDGSLTAEGTTIGGADLLRFRRITEDNVPSTTHAFLFSPSPSASVAGTLPAGRYEITLSSLSLNTGNTNNSRSISGAFTLTLTLTDPSSGSPATITSITQDEDNVTLLIDPGTSAGFDLKRSTTLTAPWEVVSANHLGTNYLDSAALPKAFYRPRERA